MSSLIPNIFGTGRLLCGAGRVNTFLHKMQRVAVINVVGLTRALLGPAMPRLQAYAQQHRLLPVRPALPAVTCTAQANYLTGQPPARHGIVGNGWYNRELAEVQFWKQSNRLVQQPKLWEELRRVKPGFTCAKLFWWYNMYASADWAITPRPLYPADGRKVFDIHTSPPELRFTIKQDLGEFPFPGFWGPLAGQPGAPGGPEAASRWIAESARWIETHHQPDLSLVYLPHLDYDLQRLGPNHPEIARDLKRIDDLAGDLLDFYARHAVQTVVLSEYGIVPVNRPVHLNRLFRQQGWLTVKDELGLETLDAGASRVFAVADHQVAHIYLNDPSLHSAVRTLLEGTPGVAQVLDEAGKAAAGIAHERVGDFLALAEPQAWFTYYYWLDDAKAPDFARTVDIHRKPGYDPAELFLDPAIPAVKLKVLGRLLQKKLGFRMLMDVIPLDATLVKGSHGTCPQEEQDYPVLLLPEASAGAAPAIASTEVYGHLQRICLGSTA